MKFIEVFCPVCSSKEKKILFSDCNRRENIPVVSNYFECLKCTMIYLSPVLETSELVKCYGTIVDSLSEQPVISRPNNGFERLLKSFVSSIRIRPHSWPLEKGNGRKILDIGCGNGGKLLEFWQRGWEIYGVDVNKNAIAMAREKMPFGHFYVGELKDVPMTKFDVIRLDNSLEHINNPKKTLLEIAAYMKENSRLFLFVPNGKSLTFSFLRRYSISSWIPFHLNLFTRKSLTRILTETGYYNVRLYDYSPSTWIPLSLKQLLYRKLWSNKTECFDKITQFIAFPLVFFTDNLHFGEELVAIAQLNCKNENLLKH